MNKADFKKFTEFTEKKIRMNILEFERLGGQPYWKDWAYGAYALWTNYGADLAVQGKISFTDYDISDAKLRALVGF